MVENHYRWDFIGLSTDSKPTADNPKVTDGSTFYESDTSKLYVWCNDQWYEKEGGGTEYEDFVGTDGTTAGTAGLVPAPATTDAGKYLKADGTWGEISGGGSNVFIIERSTTGSKEITSSYNDVKNAYNAGKLLFLPCEITTLYGQAHKGVAIFSNTMSGGASTTVPDTGTLVISAMSFTGTNTNFIGAVGIGKALLTFDADNGTVTCSTGLAMSTVIASTTSNSSTPASTSAVSTLTGYKEDLTTTSKTNLVTAINELVTNFGGVKIVKISQSDYNALSSPDANTLYFIY